MINPNDLSAEEVIELLKSGAGLTVDGSEWTTDNLLKFADAAHIGTYSRASHNMQIGNWRGIRPLDMVEIANRGCGTVRFT